MLVIKREYLTRVRKRSFIIATILTPLAIGLFFVAAGFIMAYEGDEPRHIAIIDSARLLGKDSLNLEPGKGLTFERVDGTPEEIEKNDRFDAVLELPPMKKLDTSSYQVNYYSSEGILGLGVMQTIEGKIAKELYQYKINAFGYNRDTLASLKTKVKIKRETTDDSAPPPVTAESSYTATGIGFFMGIIMYFAVFLYGMMVMRSVMEEKVNRIVEVMVSSLKPFQLMMGKIIGVGLVGLTQVAIWGILIPVILVSVQLIFGIDAAEVQQGNPMAGNAAEMDQTVENVNRIMEELSSQNWLLIVPLFIIYFLGGYLMYSSLFAAVGSAMSDDMGESQSLTLPITIPVLIAFYIMFAVVQNPDSSLATWSSMVPFFSPIVMPARLAFQPAWWEIVLSLVILIASVIFFVWLSGRIYRVGILMYGKKVTLKELWKWIFYTG